MSHRVPGVFPAEPVAPVREALSGGTAVVAFCAAAALLIGTLVYLLIRPDAAAFVPRALHRPLVMSPVITQVASWLPTLCHVVGLSLATALVAGLSRRAVIVSAGFWVAVNILFELGQHPALRAPLLAVLGRAGESGPLLLAQNFFRNGAFDPADIVAALAAGTLVVLLAAGIGGAPAPAIATRDRTGALCARQ